MWIACAIVRGKSLSVQDNFGTYTFGTLNVNIGTITLGTYKILVQSTSGMLDTSPTRQ